MASHWKKLIAREISQFILPTKHGIKEIEKLAWCIRIATPRQRSPYQFRMSYSQLKKMSEVNLQNVKHFQEILKDVPAMTGSSDVIRQVLKEEKDLLFSVSSADFRKSVLQTVMKEQRGYGTHSNLHEFTERNSQGLVEAKHNKVYIVEYSSPNIAKPFHAGHLRSTIIGNVISNILENLGHKVHRLNYLGDWGTQFGLLGVGFEKFGDENQLTDGAMEHLYNVYVEINKALSNEKSDGLSKTHDEAKSYFQRLEQGEEDVMKVWKKFRDCSIAEYSKVYKRLGVVFDEYHGESMYHQKALSLMEKIKRDGLLKTEKSTGRGYLDLEDTGEDNPKFANLLKSDGTTLYITREIAAAQDRKEKYKFDEMLYVVENGQHLHFSQLIHSLRKLGASWAERPVGDFHVKFGRVEGMSTRKGQVVFLKDILDEAQNRMIETMRSKETTKVSEAELEEVADKLGVGAIIVQDLKDKRTKNYKFSWERILNFKGDTGVFLQYSHARLCSIERQCDVTLKSDCDISLLNEYEASALIQHIAKYDEALSVAAATLEPFYIVQYLMKLAHASNAAHKSLKVQGEAENLAEARLLLFHCARTVLGNGLRILGIEPLEKI